MQSTRLSSVRLWCKRMYSIWPQAYITATSGMSGLQARYGSTSTSSTAATVPPPLDCAVGSLPQNALLDGTPERPLLKICDFGYSKNEYLDSRPKSLSGTPDYIAPEVSGRGSLPMP